MLITNKSKRKIVMSFLNISDQQDIYTISTNDIIDNANISRGTFYNHFKNKIDIVHFIEENISESLDAEFDSVDKGNSNFFHILTENVFPIVYDDREYIKVLYKFYEPELFSFLQSHYEKFLIPYFDHYDENKVGIPKYFTLSFFFRVILDAIMAWISQPIPIPTEEFRKIFYKLINNSMTEICGIVIRE
ncbi:MAG: TetR/AcrR family transcriptional regulator [Apilactobacillus sp.]|uniref:TetR/AcrR family transcriptional regulator n=1 Tax=Apilactobacillus sp. TaxID=2767901 RepID=UPI0025D770BE|nr:TetR/AcrR family transcriptional regulator [Apilactobacillus sp.]MCT6822941.1 TetR/AcrR family transcriptional regulator [Apilactobacillus sp.]